MTRFEAAILDGPHLWTMNRVTLAVREGNSYLMEDGTWQAFDEGTATEGTGIALPRGAIEAIAVAIQNWQGHASHADTEAKVLREWLAVERERVDRTLGR